MIAAGWLADMSWQSGDYTPLVAQLYPEAVARAPAGQFAAHSSLSFFGPMLKTHSSVMIFFGWGSGVKFETWSGVFLMGPLGFARVSGNPAAITALFAHEQLSLSTAPSAFEAGRLAALFAYVYEPAPAPDAFDRPDRLLFERSGLFDREHVARIDSADAFAEFVPDDPAHWAALAPRVPAPTGTLSGGLFRKQCTVTFARMDALGGGQVELSEHTVAIDRSTYELTHRVKPIGRLACKANWHPVIGRPYTADPAGHAVVAPLVRRGDWSR